LINKIHDILPSLISVVIEVTLCILMILENLLYDDLTRTIDVLNFLIAFEFFLHKERRILLLRT